MGLMSGQGVHGGVLVVDHGRAAGLLDGAVPLALDEHEDADDEDDDGRDDAQGHEDVAAANHGRVAVGLAVVGVAVGRAGVRHDVFCDGVWV